MAVTIIALVFALLTPSLALNYYIDSSCLPYPAVSRALPEALNMAGRSDARLGANDADIQAAFQRVYNTNTGDASSVKTVRDIMSGISQLTPTTDRDGADVRIYCDEDTRWRLQADRKRNGNLLPNPNSQRAPADQSWVDSVNGIFYKGPPGCKDAGTIAEVFPWQRNIPRYASQNPTRATMTLCKPYVNAAIASVEEQGNRDFSKVKLTQSALDALLSVTILHEMTHLPAYNTDDVGDAYGWANVIAKSTAAALKNAENYAFFGLLALLGDKHFKLSTVDQEAREGRLISTIAATPKRMVNSLRSLSRCKERSVRARDLKCNFLAGVVDFANKI